MVRLNTVASTVGIIAGLVTFVGVSFGLLGSSTCNFIIPHSPAGYFGCGNYPDSDLFVEVFGALLTLVSLGSFLAPKKIFFGSALLSTATAVLLFFGSSLVWLVLVSLLLDGLTLILSLMAAIRQSRVSEQSHPMNLPVFG